MPITTQDKAIATIQLGHGFFGLVWAWWVGLPPSLLMANAALAICGVAGAAGSLSGNRWASLLGVLFYALQVIHVSTPSMQFSFTLGLDAIFAAGWGAAILGVNVFALVMLLWCSTRAATRFFRKPAI